MGWWSKSPQASKGEVAWDLFAGVGLFARKLAESFARVVAVESAPQATAALKGNLRGTAGSAVRASTLDFLRGGGKGERPDLVVVDPPRTGLGGEITALLAEVAAAQLVYVSCDPATLARDLRALIATGYAIEQDYARRPVSADIPSGDSGPFAPVLIGLEPIDPFS